MDVVRYAWGVCVVQSAVQQHWPMGGRSERGQSGRHRDGHAGHARPINRLVQESEGDLSGGGGCTGGRLSFLHPETGEPARGNNKGSMFLVWHPFGRGAMQTSYVERDALMACNDDPLLPVKAVSSF